MRRIQPHIVETPLQESRWLSELSGGRVFLKLDHQQITGSFKLRGAANKLLALTAAQQKAGVVTASNGNYAFGIAAMARRLKMDAEVYVSQSIDAVRKQRIQQLGARLREISGDYLGAEHTARAEAERSGRTYAPPYNDPDVVAGQGTIAVELLRQQRGIDAVFVAVGGGGLIAGIGQHFKAHAPATEIVGCWAAHSPVMYECLRTGRIIDVVEKDSHAVSVLGGIEAGSITFPLAQKVIDRKILVDEPAILDACRRIYREHQHLVEGAAGIALGAFLQVAPQYRGRTVVVLLCGGNVDPALARLIAES